MYLGHEEKIRVTIIISSFVISLVLIVGGLLLDTFGPITKFNYRTLTLVGIGCLSISMGLFLLLNASSSIIRIDWGIRRTILGIMFITIGLSIIWITINLLQTGT